MEKAEIKVMYDKDEDILSLFKENRKAKLSQEINLPDGDLVVDFSSDGLVAGLEFFNASNYFPFLKNVKVNNIRAKMSIKYGENAINIFYNVMASGEKDLPLKQIIISPYSKKLVLEH